MVSFLAACGDLITAVFDFAHGMCALKLTEHQIALFSALVLINAGKNTVGAFFFKSIVTVELVVFPEASTLLLPASSPDSSIIPTQLPATYCNAV